MYIHVEGLSDALHKYFLHRCRSSVMFSLRVRGAVIWFPLFCFVSVRFVGCLVQIVETVGYHQMRGPGLRFFSTYLKQNKSGHSRLQGMVPIMEEIFKISFVIPDADLVWCDQSRTKVPHQLFQNIIDRFLLPHLQDLLPFSEEIKRYTHTVFTNAM